MRSVKNWWKNKCVTTVSSKFVFIQTALRGDPGKPVLELCMSQHSKGLPRVVTFSLDFLPSFLCLHSGTYRGPLPELFLCPTGSHPSMLWNTQRSALSPDTFLGRQPALSHVFTVTASSSASAPHAAPARAGVRTRTWALGNIPTALPTPPGDTAPLDLNQISLPAQLPPRNSNERGQHRPLAGWRGPWGVRKTHRYQNALKTPPFFFPQNWYKFPNLLPHTLIFMSKCALHTPDPQD